MLGSYADIEKLMFPLDADGITVGIDGGARPNILINTKLHPVRQRFTLAHELGHILIPWHTGTIISHTAREISDEAKLEYREMEAEANKFAAELLLPTTWIEKLFKQYESFSSFLNRIIDDSGASLDASLIKVFNTINGRIILADVDSSNELIRSFQSRCMPSMELPIETDLMKNAPFRSARFLEKFDIRGRSFIAWDYPDTLVVESDDREWREILENILLDCDIKPLQPSINAVLPSVYQRNKELSRESIVTKVIMAYEGRSKFKCFTQHASFEQYVVKRVDELINKNLTKPSSGRAKA
jgi:hypothetical protein